MSEWWLSRGDGKTEGPLSTQLVVKGLLAGDIPRHALVCAVGAQQWIRVSAIDEIWEQVDTTDSRTSVNETPWFIARTESGRHTLPDTEQEDERTQLLTPVPSKSETELRAQAWETASKAAATHPPSTQELNQGVRPGATAARAAQPSSALATNQGVPPKASAARASSAQTGTQGVPPKASAARASSAQTGTQGISPKASAALQSSALATNQGVPPKASAAHASSAQGSNQGNPSAAAAHLPSSQGIPPKAPAASSQGIQPRAAAAYASGNQGIPTQAASTRSTSSPHGHATDLGPMRARVPTLTGITDRPGPVAMAGINDSGPEMRHANGAGGASRDKSVGASQPQPPQTFPGKSQTGARLGAGLTPLPLGTHAASATYAGLQSLSPLRPSTDGPAIGPVAPPTKGNPPAELPQRAPSGAASSHQYRLDEPNRREPRPPPARPTTPYGASPLALGPLARGRTPEISASVAQPAPAAHSVSSLGSAPLQPAGGMSAGAAIQPHGVSIEDRSPAGSSVPQSTQARTTAFPEDIDPSPDDEKTLALFPSEGITFGVSGSDDDEPTRFLPKVISPRAPQRVPIAQGSKQHQSNAPRPSPVRHPQSSKPDDSVDENTAIFQVDPVAAPSAVASSDSTSQSPLHHAQQSAFGNPDPGGEERSRTASLVSDPSDLLEDVDDESPSVGRLQAVPLLVVPQQATTRPEPTAPSVVASPPSKPPQARRARLSVPTIVLKPEPLVHQEATQPAVRALRRRSPVRLSYGSLITVLLVLAAIALATYFALRRT